MTAEQLGFLIEKLINEGALDVYFTNIYMKKNRPAIMLSLLCTKDKKDYFSEALLKHTSTFGIRYNTMERDILDRKIIQMDTEYGSVRIKLGILNGNTIKYSPEYEDCKLIAQKTGRPIQHIYADILNQYNSVFSENSKSI